MVGQERSTVAEIHLIAAQTLQRIERRERFFWFLTGRKADLHRQLAELVRCVGGLNPSGFSESDFSELTGELANVIDSLERYFAKLGNPNDPAECQFLGQSLTSLKDARRWIAQGQSPDPAKRMPADSRDSLLDQAAEDAFTALHFHRAPPDTGSDAGYFLGREIRADPAFPRA